MSGLIPKVLEEGIVVLQAVANDSALHTMLEQAAEKTSTALKSGRKLMVAGNGGSAADAQHLVAEFVGRFIDERPAMRAIALTTNSSVVTAIGNDYGYEQVFARQIEALGQAGDVFLAISTSGNSPNLLRALELSRKMGITTVGLTGSGGGKMAQLCDCLLAMPSSVTIHIQQAHLALEHAFCMLVERGIFGDAMRAKSVPEE